MIAVVMPDTGPNPKDVGGGAPVPVLTDFGKVTPHVGSPRFEVAVCETPWGSLGDPSLLQPGRKGDGAMPKAHPWSGGIRQKSTGRAAALARSTVSGKAKR